MVLNYGNSQYETSSEDVAAMIANNESGVALSNGMIQSNLAQNIRAFSFEGNLAVNI